MDAATKPARKPPTLRPKCACGCGLRIPKERYESGKTRRHTLYYSEQHAQRVYKRRVRTAPHQPRDPWTDEEVAILRECYATGDGLKKAKEQLPLRTGVAIGYKAWLLAREKADAAAVAPPPLPARA